MSIPKVILVYLLALQPYRSTEAGTNGQKACAKFAIFRAVKNLFQSLAEILRCAQDDNQVSICTSMYYMTGETQDFKD
jgi:hypothetical protein